MPSKPLTDLQKEYNKVYGNYLRRIKSARAAGIDIPERYIKPKKEKPRRRDIETLKAITRSKLIGNKNVSVKTETDKAYDREYNNYLKRVKSARQAGFIIPEESVIPKAEKPTAQAINEIKRINREAFKRKTLTGEINFVSPATGEVLERTQAFRQARKRRLPQELPVKEIQGISIEESFSLADQLQFEDRYREWMLSKDNVSRPTDFNEYIKIVEKVNDYIDKYNPPESSREFIIDKLIERELRNTRGARFSSLFRARRSSRDS